MILKANVELRKALLSRVKFLFNKHSNQTEVIIIFDPESKNPIELQRQGWQAILDNFKGYVDNN